ncbi:MAG: hypothetical protein JNM76_18425 [Betaproteobacteria bacterium]|nr:hypothetical protein [Betaproteobacteria bacterium]
MTARLLLTAATTLLCTFAQAQDIAAAGFLAGNWVEKTERGETQEMWAAPRGDMMAAVNSSLRGTRAGFEFLRIVKRDGKLIYLASPGGRTPPTEFPLKENGENRLVFENPTHDFPTRILYTRDGDTLIARIEGTMGGKERAMEWRFKRAS